MKIRSSRKMKKKAVKICKKQKTTVHSTQTIIIKWKKTSSLK